MSVRRRLAVVVAALLVTTPLHASAAGFAEEMPDAQLRACVTDKLGLAEGAEPSQAELDSIIELSCTGRGITDATGVGELSNLTKLFLGGNALRDITPIASAAGLRSLGLQGNQISDITPLRSLTGLTSISLDNNRLSDISVLGTLPSLTRLNAGTRHAQKALGAAAVATQPAPVPTVVGWHGTTVRPAAPEGAELSGSTVSYPEPGTYTWSFRDPEDLSFNGSVTVEVTAPSSNTVPDEALRSCLNNKIEPGRPAEQHPTVEELAGLTGGLTCSNKGVADLTGLNLATGLSGTVNLSNNSITDVGPLSRLTNVRSLNLFQNEITSLVPLGALPNLTSLSVQRSAASTKAKLVSLAGVERLTGLTSLTVNHQDLTSLAPLAGHPSLATLYATDNLISDVSPLAEVPLGSRLDLRRNRVSDLSPLGGKSISTLNVTEQEVLAPPAIAGKETEAPAVTTVEGASLLATPPSGVTVAEGKVTYAEAGNHAWTWEVKPSAWQAATFSGTITQQVAEVPPVVVDVAIPDANLRACLAEALDREPAQPISVEMLAGLTTVSCVGDGIVDLTGAELLTGATEIVLSSNQIADLSPLAGLSGVARLLVPGNQVADLGPLGTMSGLTTLNVSNNPFTTIEPLATLTGLTDLDISQRAGRTGHPGVESITAVAGMTGLTRLNVNNARVTDLAPLEGLTHLTNLAASNNAITDIAALGGLTGLTNVNLRDNQISSVQALGTATGITTLGLSGNRLTDLSALAGLTKLGFLQPAASGQSAQLPPVPAELMVAVPQVRGIDGVAVAASAPEGLNVIDGMVEYPAEGSYDWTFEVRDADGLYFSGVLTQPVTAPVADAAVIPDANLRACLAAAAGVEAASAPTDRDLAAVTEADCSGLLISDLTGLGYLTAIESLDLSGAGLASVAPLAELTTLRALTVDDNHVSDLSPLAELPNLARLSATGQLLDAGEAEAGISVPVPSVTTLDGGQVAASAPAEADVADGRVAFSRAGEYLWPFSAQGGAFTGRFTMTITTDVADESVHDPAGECLAKDNVWVVVEYETGLQEGGCATEFGNGVQALESAGFTVSGSGFVTHINGHPSGQPGDFYWSYWHATNPSVTSEVTGDERVTTREFDWSYSTVAPGAYEPAPGTIEGWRFAEFGTGGDPVAPSWEPIVIMVEPTPVPTVDPTVVPTEPTSKPTVTPTTTAPVVGAFVPTAPYTKPGLHMDLNGRDWNTSCEPYSQTERCRTDIWATVVHIKDGKFVRETAWAFNNLTYLPYMTKQAWGDNPLANTGEWTATTDNRQWRTECGTARTGADGCRSYAMVTVYKATAKPEGGYVFSQDKEWVFNNIVMLGGPEKR